MAGLPPKPFNVVRRAGPKANRQGKFSLDGPHPCSSDPALAGRELLVGLTATTAGAREASGAFVCPRPRAHGSAPTDTCDPASRLAVLAVKSGGWRESGVRSSLPEELRAYTGSLGKGELRAGLRLMRDQSAASGWEATVAAMSAALSATGRVEGAGVAVAAARAGSGAVDYGAPVDLAERDRALGVEGVA